MRAPRTQERSEMTRRWRVLLVTFDLSNTLPGDARYRLADGALAFHGDVFWPIKQLRLLLTQNASGRVLASLEQQLGRNVSIMIIEMRNVRQIHIADRQKRAEWRRFERALDRVGLGITGL